MSSDFYHGLLDVVVPGTQHLTQGIDQIAEGVTGYLKKLPKLGERYAIFEKVRDELRDLAKDHRIAIVIDDLDRCEPSAIAHVLRCVPTLFAPDKEGPNYVLVLGLDRNVATRALVHHLGWDAAYVSGYLDKVINVHITLPMLQLGSGNRQVATESIVSAIRNGGKRKNREVRLPDYVTVRSEDLNGKVAKYQLSAQFEIPADRCLVIARFMHFNPRELERFCILFDLKWNSRILANAHAWANGKRRKRRPPTFSEWLQQFADRLIWESVVELRWPLYDSKTADDRTNSDAIDAAIKGCASLSVGLPCEEFVKDRDFLEICRLYREWSEPRRKAAN